MGGLLERLETWVNEGTRSIKIEVNNFGGHVTRSIFVYDGEIGEGKMLDSLNDLERVDFLQVKKDRELELLKQLEAKYNN